MNEVEKLLPLFYKQTPMQLKKQFSRCFEKKLHSLRKSISANHLCCILLGFQSVLQTNYF